MKIAGLDIGTTGCKCTVFDDRGLELGRAYREYPVRRALSGHEMDPEALLEGVYDCIRQVAGMYPDIEGIGVTSFGESFVCTDVEGKPLGPIMLYTDPRGGRQCERLTKGLGAERIVQIAGVNPHETYSLPKIMWLRENCPQVYEKTRHIFLMVDFVVFHLTGVARIDYSLACRTMGFDIRRLCWSEEIFEAAGIDHALMSRPVPTGTVAGHVTPEAARKVGLGVHTRVVTISHDQMSAAIGAGAFDSSVAVDGAGTVQCLTPIYDGMPDLTVMSRGNYAVVPYVIPGKYVAYAFSYTGGALLQWCLENVCKKEADIAREKEISPNGYLEQLYAFREEPSGLLVLPHFAGAATPYMDAGSKGAILGLTMATTGPEIYRGCMEAVAYEMYLNLLRLKESGICFEKLHATGGGARSAEWMQMKADVLGVPIETLKTADAGTVGSAMLTGVAVGCFRNLEEAAGCMVVCQEIYKPREWMHEKYEKIYKRYAAVYDAVRGLM